MWIVSSEENVAKVVDILQKCSVHPQKTPSFARSEETSFLLPHSKELRVFFSKHPARNGGPQSVSLQFIKIQIHTHLIQLGTYFCDVFLISRDCTDVVAVILMTNELNGMNYGRKHFESVMKLQ